MIRLKFDNDNNWHKTALSHVDLDLYFGAEGSLL